MDPSRPSNVSSFYDSQGRRESFDPNHAFSQQPPSSVPIGHRPRMDSSTSSAFYNTNRASQNSADILTGDMGPPGQRGMAGSAGYNRTSFFAPGREAPVKGGTDEQQPLQHQGSPGVGGQDEGWDVYADFNNAGPRYSNAFVPPSTTGYVHVIIWIRISLTLLLLDIIKSLWEHQSQKHLGPNRAQVLSSSSLYLLWGGNGKRQSYVP